MSKIFITGSTDGLGFLAAQDLIKKGHEVFLHARNHEKKIEVLKRLPNASAVFVSDFGDKQQTISLAEELRESYNFDAVIHNAGVYNAPGNELFCVNVLAPYLLTSIMKKPQRLIYVSSDMHLGGKFNVDALNSNRQLISYSDSKLQVLMLCNVFARYFPDLFCNALHPGWVPTKMGGKNAPDNLQKGYETQVWLSESNDKEALVTSRYFFHKKQKQYHTLADDIHAQEMLMQCCEKLTGITCLDKN